MTKKINQWFINSNQGLNGVVFLFLIVLFIILEIIGIPSIIWWPVVFAEIITIVLLIFWLVFLLCKTFQKYIFNDSMLFIGKILMVCLLLMFSALIGLFISLFIEAFMNNPKYWRTIFTAVGLIGAPWWYKQKIWQMPPPRIK